MIYDIYIWKRRDSFQTTKIFNYYKKKKKMNKSNYDELVQCFFKSNKPLRGYGIEHSNVDCHSKKMLEC